LYCLRSTANGQAGNEILSSAVQISTAAMTVSQSIATVTDSLSTPTRAPISALDQAMAATLAAITVPSPQTGIKLFA
jgi:hypothetical protein